MKIIFTIVLLLAGMSVKAQTEKSGLNFDIQSVPEQKKQAEVMSREQAYTGPAVTCTINKSNAFFSRCESKGDDIEILVGVNPRVNGTRMEAMEVKYALNGRLTSAKTRVSGYGGQELPRNGNVLNRGNRVNGGETFYVTATIKNVAYLHELSSVSIRVWTSYGEGDVILKNVKW